MIFQLPTAELPYRWCKCYLFEVTLFVLLAAFRWYEQYVAWIFILPEKKECQFFSFLSKEAGQLSLFTSINPKFSFETERIRNKSTSQKKTQAKEPSMLIVKTSLPILLMPIPIGRWLLEPLLSTSITCPCAIHTYSNGDAGYPAPLKSTQEPILEGYPA